MTQTLTRCSRCGHRRELAPGLRTCDPCRAKLRQYNATRRDAKREWNRSDHAKAWRRRYNAKRREAERTTAGRPSFEEIAAARDTLTIATAARLGYVPSINVIAEATGTTLAAAAVRRRRLFNLKPAKSGSIQPRIPYPVPAEYQRGPA